MAAVLICAEYLVVSLQHIRASVQAANASRAATSGAAGRGRAAAEVVAGDDVAACRQSVNRAIGGGVSGFHAGSFAQVSPGRYGITHAVADFQNLAVDVTAVVISGHQNPLYISINTNIDIIFSGFPEASSAIPMCTSQGYSA